MSIQCPFCEGSGIKEDSAIIGREYGGVFDEAKCPHCVNGEITLAVECGCKSGRRGPKCYDYHVPPELRPLTGEEADLVVHRYAAQPSMSAKEFQERKDAKARDRIRAIERGIVTLRGLPVVIKKREL